MSLCSFFMPAIHAKAGIHKNLLHLVALGIVKILFVLLIKKMLAEKYKNMIKETVYKYMEAEVRIFIFGSSAVEDEFFDIDVGIEGEGIRDELLLKVKEDFEESLIPYKIDLVDFSKVDDNFKEKVFKTKIIWLT